MDLEKLRSLFDLLVEKDITDFEHEQEGVVVVAQGEEGDFLAFQVFFDHDGRAGFAEDSLVHDSVDRGHRFFRCLGYGDAFAGCQAVGFDEVGIQRRHGRLDGQWKDCVLVERLLGDAASS